MKCLSIDCSTTKAGISLLTDDEVTAEASWISERARHEGLFDVAENLVASAGWRWEEIELFVVGRGPGAYSGLRVSLLAAQAWAAPSGRPVLAVSSMEAAARALMDRESIPQVMVVGDARRNTYWYGLVSGDQPDLIPEWRTIPCEQLPGIVPAGTAVVTPHPEVIATFSATGNRLKVRMIDVRSVDVARLALRRWRAGLATEALTPLYMHAAV